MKNYIMVSVNALFLSFLLTLSKYFRRNKAHLYSFRNIWFTMSFIPFQTKLHCGVCWNVPSYMRDLELKSWSACSVENDRNIENLLENKMSNLLSLLLTSNKSHTLIYIAQILPFFLLRISLVKVIINEIVNKLNF